MINIIKAVSKISIASATNIFTGIIRTKIFAIILGTAGIGIISQLSNFSNLAIFVGAVGIPVGVIKYVSEYEKEGRWSEIKDILGKCLIIIFSMGLFFVIITIVFAKQFSFLILDSDSYSLLLIVTACTFPFALTCSIFDAFIRGLKKFNQFVKISVISSVISLIISIFLVIFYKLTGFVFSLLINSIVNIIIYVIYFHWTKIIRLKELFVFKATSGTTLKNILKLGIASLIAETINQGTILLIRSLIVKGYGVDINGVYQCVVSLSNNYFLLFYMSISAYVLPVLSEIKDIDRLNEQINEIYRFTLFIVVPIITFTFVLREIVILLLYTSKFMQASNLVVYNFTGDFFKALAWVLGAWLIPRSKFKLWMIIAILFNVYFFSIFALLTFYFKMDIISAVIAYAISNFMHFVVNLYFIKKYNNFRFKIDSFKLMLYSGIFVLIILLISSYKTSLGYFFIIPFFLLWMKLSIKKEEFMKLLSLIKIKY